MEEDMSPICLRIDIDELLDIPISVFDHIHYYMSGSGTQMLLLSSLYGQTRPILLCTYGEDMKHKQRRPEFYAGDGLE